MAITIEQLQSQIYELQSQLGKASEHGSDLLQALKTERGRIADLEQELAAQASRFEDGGAELKSAAGWAKADQRRLRTELGAALAAEAVAVAQLEDDKDVVAAKDRELEVFKRRFGEQSQEIIRLRAMLAEVDFERRDVQSLQARLTLLEGAKLGYDKEKVELEAQKAAAEERAADLELQLTDLRAQSAAAEKRSAVIESQLADLRGQGQELLVKTPSLQHTAITTATPHQASIIDKIEEIKRALSASGERVKSLSEELRATKEEAAVQATRHAAELDTAKAKTVEQAARHARELDAAKAETAAQAARHVAELDTAKAETAKQAASHARELDAAKAETAKQAVRHAAELDAAKAKTVEQAASHARELDAAKAETAKQAVRHAAELDAAKAKTVEQAASHARELDAAKAETAEQATRHARELDAAKAETAAQAARHVADLDVVQQAHATEIAELAAAADVVHKAHEAEKAQLTAAIGAARRVEVELVAAQETAAAEIIELKRQLAQAATDAAGAVQSPITPFRTRTSQDAALQTEITTTPATAQTFSDQWVQFETLTFQNRDSYFVKRDSTSSVKAEVRTSKHHNKLELALEVFLTMYLAGSKPGSTPTVYAKGSDPELVALYYAYAKLFEAAGMKIAITGSVPNESQLVAATDKIKGFFCPTATAEAVDASTLGKKIVSLYMAPKGCADSEMTEFLKTQLGYADTGMSSKVKAAGGIYLAGQNPVDTEHSLGLAFAAGKQKFESIGLLEQVVELLKIATQSEYDNPSTFISEYSSSVARARI